MAAVGVVRAEPDSLKSNRAPRDIQSHRAELASTNILASDALSQRKPDLRSDCHCCDLSTFAASLVSLVSGCLTSDSTGAAQASFIWFPQYYVRGPVNRSVRRLSLALDQCFGELYCKYVQLKIGG